MIDFLLIGIIVALLVFVYYKDREHVKQINQLIKAVISKTPQDYRDLMLADNTKIDMKPESSPLGPLMDDYVAIGAADSQAFDKMISKQLDEDDSMDVENDLNEHQSTS